MNISDKTPTAIYRVKTLVSLLGISRAFLYKKISDGSFPAPDVQLGVRARGWSGALISEAVQKMQSQMAATQKARDISAAKITTPAA